MFQSLRVRNFKLYFWGQVASQTGTWMQTIALGWWVVELSHSDGVAVGFAVACQFIPTLLFGVWAGMLADRFDKRILMMVTQTGLAVFAVLFAVLDVTGVVQLWMLYVLIFGFGVFFTLDNLLRQSIVPELVPAADLPNAIGLNSATIQGARVIGPAIAGVLIVAVGTGVCFTLNAVSYLFVIGALVMIRPAEQFKDAPVAREKGQIRQGLRYIWRTPELRSTLLILVVVGTFAINAPVVLPLLARLTFHGNADTYSWLTIGYGIGAFLGALLWAARGRARVERLVFNGVLFGTAICVSSVAPSLALFVGLVVFVGLGQTLLLSTANSLLQLTSAPQMRGRVMSVYIMALLGTTPIGGPLLGWIAEQFGARWAFATGGIATLAAIAVFGGSLLRARRRVDALVSGTDEVVLGVDGEVISPAVR
jgi:MFS family permease